MVRKIQEGIFYDTLSRFKKHGNHSYAILFLRVLKGHDARQVFDALKNIWRMYELLKKGIITDLSDRRLPIRGMSILIGFGPEIFNIAKVKKIMPRDFYGKQFLPALPERPILDGCGINYSKHLSENVGTMEHVAIQIISETQLAVYRSVVDTWNHLTHIKRNENCLRLSKFYTGFQRNDGRSWLGFHDEISNLKDAKERRDVISINRRSNQLKPDDFWTEDGTYMAYLRTEIDLDVWNKLKQKDQEIIVGRSKITGSPIVGIDEDGKPTYARIYRKNTKIGSYDPKYHDHPDYFKVSTSSSSKVKEERTRALLTQSHIGRVRHINNLSSRDPTSRRIYRQGFEFIEYLANDKKPVRVGQNFVSFQSDPRRLTFILTDPRWMGNSNFGGPPGLFDQAMLSVKSAGMFFVPAKEEPFPGASIFC